MPKGRPPDLVFDPEYPGPVAQAVAYVDDRGRIQLPKKIIGGLNWIAKDRTTDALVVLTEPDVVRLRSWDDGANLVLQRRRQLIERAHSEPAAIDLLRALEDRYKRFQIPSGARPTLTTDMILHLGLSPFTPVSIYVWRILNVVELNSSAHRAKELEVDWEELGDLPE